MNNKVLCIIQARMGSKRLPGKTLIPICGKPVLEHIIMRLSGSKLINQVVIATTGNKDDDQIVDVAEGLKGSYKDLDCFRGDEDDVLDRYYKAAVRFGGKCIVRITADCPLIDPRVVDKVIDGLMHNQPNIDFAANTINRTYPRGLDVSAFTFSALEKSWREAKDSKYREHVVMYIHKNPQIFNKLSVESDNDLSQYRLTLDTREDLKLIEGIYEKLYRGKVFYLPSIIKLLQAEPELTKVNEGIKQKES